MRTLLLGAGGQLGHELVRGLARTLAPGSNEMIDSTDRA